MSQHKVVLLLGSNLGEQKKNVELALKRLKDAGNNISQTSEYLMSEPVEFASSNIFCNIAAIIFTPLSPIQLLDCIKNIEVEMGRINDSKVSGGYTDRIIDIDIIKYNELNFQSERLEIPHKKHLFERDFSRVLLKDFI
ncbi:2-amino-4-hydroxy-6-hydroxymethyldihydropteridine diphosphokinase [Chryseobacterium sp. D764]|jgi:2-amino-4-hydroxy-6-hydroxymethyldihydropteridine diphosphokinase|uniref:2-amino-4-hydroxy-6- hydroxymethyldihydropteridine diphosphokinase n=1 Tax=unclassified Chryseobacterium TaxID=2593645 RepID=UPI000985F905|nr:MULTISPECIES: 2-amino-4-hydroxy-6-hydroxymethyldihydropteridine diphosphokinase [unclassified Chryseobacterium]QXU51500.1 2-amino-4-hydroxy-6-hydroxymethyldihydropteridine diphosphokinase [Chryseobacterium sp. D764]CAD0221077.1 2-amino-4-hydroxy-6-hydroxymethyldihydropteridinepyrophosphokinase [Chryseobacterium sp. JV274]